MEKADTRKKSACAAGDRSHGTGELAWPSPRWILFLKGAVDAILTRSHLQHAKSSALEPGALFREGIVLKAKGGFSARLGRCTLGGAPLL